MKLRRNLLLVVAMLVLSGMLAPMAGAGGGGYTPGTEGGMGPTVPPPGFHYKIYNILVNSDTVVDPDGDDQNIGFDLNVFAQAHRFCYMTNKKFLGADFGMSLIIPIVAVDNKIGAFNSSDSDIDLGDIFFEPVVLGWHTPRWDVALGIGFQFPTGHWYNSHQPANGSVGSGGYSNLLLTTGATYYLDQARTWTVSALSRTVVYFGDQDETEYQPGNEFVIDYGLTKEFALSKDLLLRPALVGYSYWQISDDENRYDGGSNGDHGRRYALGAEVNLFWLPGLYQVNLRYLHDLGSKDEIEADTVVLSLIKSF